MNQTFENDALIKTASKLEITIKFDIVTLVVIGIIILGAITINKAL